MGRSRGLLLLLFELGDEGGRPGIARVCQHDGLEDVPGLFEDLPAR